MKQIVLLVFTFFFIIGAYCQNSNNWNNSRGNAQLQGITSSPFPKKVKLNWTYDADGIFKSAPVVSNGKIVVGSTNGELICLDLKGKLIWKFKTDNSIEASALIENGIVYAGNLSGMLYAIDLAIGTKKWEYKTDNQIMGAPTFAELSGKKIVMAASYDFNLHGVDAITGKGLWKYESENYLNSSPAINNKEAIFGGCDGFLHQVNILDGKLIAKSQVATYVASSPAIVDNRAFVGDYDGGFSCIDLTTKKVVWKYQNKDSSQPFIASPSVIGNHVIIGSRDKFVYCFNKQDGTIEWKENSGNRVDASPVANKENTLIVNMRGDVILFDNKTGKKIWTYELGSGIMNTPAVIEGIIIVAGSDGNIYCLGGE